MRTLIVFAASICLSVVPAQAPNPDQASIEFVQRLRQADGGYAPNTQRGTARSSIRATAAAVRALKYLGGEPPSVETVRFLERCLDRGSGGFGDLPGQSATVATTAVGTMAAVDLDLQPQLYRDDVIRYLSDNTKSPEDIRIASAAFEALKVRPPKAAEWLRQIEATRNSDGTFGSGRDTARATGGTAALILRLGGTLEHREGVMKAMRVGQRPDGGFGSAARDGSDLESTYRVMRALMMLKERPAESVSLREFVGRCRHPSGGYAFAPGDVPSAAGTYYAAAVLHWLHER